MMHDDLFALQQKVAQKLLLESKLYELHTQRRQYDNQVISLRVAFRKEQEDVKKLDGLVSLHTEIDVIFETYQKI